MDSESMTASPALDPTVSTAAFTATPSGPNPSWEWLPTPELNAALAKAQGAMVAATKDAENPHFRSTYATLAAVVEVARKPLAANGLSVIQKIHSLPSGSVVGVETELRHASGQRITFPILWLPYDVQKGRSAVQAVGSAITYGRRYALMGALGIPTEDDDGNGAGSGTRGGEKKKPRQYPSDAPLDDLGKKKGDITDAQRRAIYALTKKLGKDDDARAKLLESHGVESSTELTKKQASQILDDLKKEEADAQG